MYERPCRAIPHAVEDKLLEEAEPAILAIVNRAVKGRVNCAKLGISVEDILQEVRIEVWKAAKRFDPAQGCKFTSFVEKRIHGAVIDAIRRADPVARTYRAKLIAQGDIEYGQAVPIDDSCSRDHIADMHKDALADLIEEENKTMVHMMMSRLSKRHLLLVKMYFFDDQTQAQIAQKIGVSECRVSQLLRESILQIRHHNRIAVQEAKSKRSTIRFKWMDFINETGAMDGGGKEVSIPEIWKGRHAEFRYRLQKALHNYKSTCHFKWKLNTKNGVCRITRIQ